MSPPAQSYSDRPVGGLRHQTVGLCPLGSHPARRLIHRLKNAQRIRGYEPVYQVALTVLSLQPAGASATAPIAKGKVVSTSPSTLYVGVDIAKESLMAAIYVAGVA